MMHSMLQQVQQSMDAREVQVKEFEAQIKAYQAETDRIKSVESGLNDQQVQDIIMGTLAGMLSTGELVPPSAERVTPQMEPAAMPPEGMQ
jgi:Tfp pilus assembly protein PilN